MKVLLFILFITQLSCSGEEDRCFAGLSWGANKEAVHLVLVKKGYQLDVAKSTDALGKKITSSHYKGEIFNTKSSIEFSFNEKGELVRVNVLIDTDDESVQKSSDIIAGLSQKYGQPDTRDVRSQDDVYRFCWTSDHSHLGSFYAHVIRGGKLEILYRSPKEPLVTIKELEKRRFRITGQNLDDL